jgi:hypothetical protein
VSGWPALFQRPDHLSNADGVQDWFTRIAEKLLNGSQLLVAGQAHRFREVEFYYFAREHLDPFTHRDPVQHQYGRWYFHRTGSGYRSGSFKGVDLTFGDAQATGGILIRSLHTPAGKLVDGPSLCVDHILALTDCRDVAALDAAIDGRLAWGRSNPLQVTEVKPAESAPLFRSARVGLSLKRWQKSPEPPSFILRPYRYLTEPRRIKKGKLHLVLALHVAGTDPETIHQLTACPRASIQRYLTDFELGRQEKDFSAYQGIDLGPRELCRLHGTWHTLRP